MKVNGAIVKIKPNPDLEQSDLGFFLKKAAEAITFWEDWPPTAECTQIIYLLGNKAGKVTVRPNGDN